MNPPVVPDGSEEIAKISAKIPPFWKQNVTLWFVQVEANFRTARVTRDQTMFDIVIGNLDGDVLTTISDLVTNPPATGKYEALKKRLVDRFALSQRQKIRQLLSKMELGDERPSDLLRRMRELAGTSISDEILRDLFLERLPEESQKILATLDIELDKLAATADKICECTPSINAIAKNRNKGSHSEGEDPDLRTMIQQLAAVVTSLATQVSSITRRDRRTSSNSRSRNPSRSASRQRDSSGTRSDLCWYHRVFGDQAHSCRAPCSRNKNHSEN